MPLSPNPAHGATDVSLDQVLEWQSSDPDGDPITYTVAFGKDYPPTVVDSVTVTSYDPSRLRGTVHYWIITVSDGISTTAGSMWVFGITSILDYPVFLPLVGRSHSSPIPSEEVHIPAGTFQMGCDSSNPNEYCRSTEQPLHNVYLDDYYIDKHEATNAQYKACVDAAIGDPPASNWSYTRPDYFGNQVYDDYPVIFRGPMLLVIAPGQASGCRPRPSGKGQLGGAATHVCTPGEKMFLTA